MTGAIVCWASCWSCKFGHCYDPPQAHPWWDQEDAECAESAGQPAPQGNCACACGQEPS